AASNGITSLELFDKLQTHQGLKLHASDYFDHLLLVRVPETHWTVVFDVDKRPLQAVGGRFVISLQRDALKRHPANRLVQAWVRRRVLPKAEQALSAASDEASISTDGPHIRNVSLFHPLCQRRSQSDNRFQLRRH